MKDLNLTFMNKAWQQQFHLALRARAFVTGELGKRKISSQKAYYAVIASDTSANHRQLLVERLMHYQIPYVITFTQTQLQEFTDKSQVAFLVITNPHLAKALKEKEHDDER